jgi:SOS-response transcriptional repressor LexA
MDIQTQKEWKIKNKVGLTPQQKKMYDVIVNFIKTNKYSPSYEELKQLCGLRSKSGVHRIVHLLVRRHWLGKQNGANRSLFII